MFLHQKLLLLLRLEKVERWQGLRQMFHPFLQFLSHHLETHVIDWSTREEKRLM